MLYYYTDEAMIAMGHISSSQMTSAILGLVEETNIAMLHSGVALTLTVTAVGGVSNICTSTEIVSTREP